MSQGCQLKLYLLDSDADDDDSVEKSVNGLSTSYPIFLKALKRPRLRLTSIIID